MRIGTLAVVACVLATVSAAERTRKPPRTVVYVEGEGTVEVRQYISNFHLSTHHTHDITS